MSHSNYSFSPHTWWIVLNCKYLAFVSKSECYTKYEWSRKNEVNDRYYIIFLFSVHVTIFVLWVFEFLHSSVTQMKLFLFHCNKLNGSIQKFFFCWYLVNIYAWKWREKKLLFHNMTNLICIEFGTFELQWIFMSSHLFINCLLLILCKYKSFTFSRESKCGKLVDWWQFNKIYNKKLDFSFGAMLIAILLLDFIK